MTGCAFGERLREIRQSAGMTIEELSAASGVSGRAISDMERGHSRAPQERTLAALTGALGLADPDRAGLVALVRAERAGSRVGRPRTGELPRGIGDFVGREQELRELRGHAASGGGRTPVALVHGQPGLGKTALAIRAAEQMRDLFPDGQVYLDLRGTDPEPMGAGEALRRLLRALGVESRGIAEDEQERAGQLRAITRERRCLLVLDNAADEGQVRPLLPGAGAGMVVVTSRRLLGGLAGVLRIGLTPLTPAESAQLLRAVAGRAFDQAPGYELGAVTRLCGHLPLALRIAGTRLASRPGWTMGHLAGRLADADRRLANLQVGDLGVAAAFALSYAQLSGPAKVLFRRLAHVPGADFAAAHAAVLAEVDTADAEDRLDELTELGLLQHEGCERYRFHDLIRLYAADRLRCEESAQARARTGRRMVDWLLDTAVAAGLRFAPDAGARGGPGPDDRPGLPAPASPEQARAWLRAEADNWLPALRSAAADGRHQQVADVGEALHWHAERCVHTGRWPEVFGLSRAAAARLPDRRQEIAHLAYHGWAVSVCQRRHTYGVDLAMQAYRLAEDLGDTREQAAAMHHAAHAWRLGADACRAVAAYRLALDLAGTAGDHDGYVQVRMGLAQALVEFGRPAEAIEEFRGVLRELDARALDPAAARMAAMTARAALARCLGDVRRWPQSLAEAMRALPLAGEHGPHFAGRVHLTLGRSHSALGATEQARAHLTRAIDLLGSHDSGHGTAGSRAPSCTRALCEVEIPVWAWHRGIAQHAHIGVHCAEHRTTSIGVAQAALAALDGRGNVPAVQGAYA
ncbi:helix-turn-helix domain-containing protein [Catellatospora sp. NPDC049133]|uniref:ATP-binding protein n=1 Tax=Catellatospora sp. NPDC049133 TaxID=3155499 RepID=UPI0033D82A24